MDTARLVDLLKKHQRRAARAAHTLGSPVDNAFPQIDTSSSDTTAAVAANVSAREILGVAHALGLTPSSPRDLSRTGSFAPSGSAGSAMTSDSEGSDEGGNLLTSMVSSAKRFQGLLKTTAEDQYIELAEPYRIYQPGDQVKGQVIVKLAKPTPTLYMSLRLTGQVLTGQGKQRVRSTLFTEYLLLYGKQAGGEVVSERASTTSSCRSNRQSWQTQMMEAGRHVFDFACQLPDKSLPSSVDFGKGSITYGVRCDHQKPRSLLSRGKNACRKNLQVQDLIDIALIPRPRPCILDPDAKSKRREGAGRVRASIELARAGCLAGQTITLTIQLQHVKPIKNLRGVVATLYRLSRFDVTDSAPQSFRKDLAQSISPLLVDPATLRFKVSPRLKIPADTFPTIKAAGPVSFRYFVEVVLDLSSKTTVWQTGASSPSDNGQHFSVENGGAAMDTEALKREKDAHCVVFEVTLGTRDSATGRPADLQRRESADVIQQMPSPASQHSPRLSIQATNQHATRERSRTIASESSFASPQAIEFDVVEKQAMRQFEEALLPSEPPMAYQDAALPEQEIQGSSSRQDDSSGVPDMSLLRQGSGKLRSAYARDDAAGLQTAPKFGDGSSHLRPSSPGMAIESSLSEHGGHSPHYQTSGIPNASQVDRGGDADAVIEQELPTYMQARQVRLSDPAVRGFGPS